MEWNYFVKMRHWERGSCDGVREMSVCIFSLLMRSFYLWTTFCGGYRILSHTFSSHMNANEHSQSFNISCLHLHLHRMWWLFKRGGKIYQFTSHIVNEKPKVRCYMLISHIHTHTGAPCMCTSEMERTHKFCFPSAIENLRAIFSLKLQAKQEETKQQQSWNVIVESFTVTLTSYLKNR